MVRDLDDLRQHAVGRHAGEAQARLLQPVLVVDVDLVAVAVALADRGRAVDRRATAAARLQDAPDRRRAASCRRDRRRPCAAPARCRASIRSSGRPPAPAQGPNSVEPAPLQAGQIARRLDHRHLHAEADAEDTAPGARGRSAPPRSCPRCRARRSRRAPGCRARLRAAATASVALEDLGVDPVELDLHVVGDAAVAPAPRPATCRRRAGACTCRRRRSSPRPPARGCASTICCQRRGPAASARRGRNAGSTSRSKPFGVIGERHVVDRVDVERRDHRAPAARCRTARSCAARRPGSAGRSGTAGCRAGCRRPSSSFTECCVGLVFSSPAEGMYGTSVRCTNSAALRPELVAELADRLEERQALDVADRAADLAQHEIVVVGVGLDELLDRVGDVRDHLDGGAEIVAAPLRGDHVGIDAPGGDVVGCARRARR